MAVPPAASAGEAHVSWTLEIRHHGKVVRTAGFHETRTQTAAAMHPFLEPGYWTIDLWHGRSVGYLCGGDPCTDAQRPFDKLGLVSATNVEVTTLSHTGRRTFLVKGTIKISRSGTITAASAFVWFCMDKPLQTSCANSGSGFRTAAATPVEVAAGDQATATAVIELRP